MHPTIPSMCQKVLLDYLNIILILYLCGLLRLVLELTSLAHGGSPQETSRIEFHIYETRVEVNADA